MADDDSGPCCRVGSEDVRRAGTPLIDKFGERVDRLRWACFQGGLCTELHNRLLVWRPSVVASCVLSYQPLFRLLDVAGARGELPNQILAHPDDLPRLVAIRDPVATPPLHRSEERRLGNEVVSTCLDRWAAVQ